LPQPGLRHVVTLVAEAITTDAASMPGTEVTCTETAIKETESL